MRNAAGLRHFDLANTFGLATLIMLTLTPREVYAQVPSVSAPGRPAQGQQTEKDPYGRDTPHGCVFGFLRAAERGDYSHAAQYLDVRPGPKAEELAQQLQFVMNRGLSSSLDSLSRAPEGDLKDELPKNRDRVGRVQTPAGSINILLDRLERGTGPPIWVFSSETLRQVPEAFQEFDTSGIERFIPETLKAKFFSVPLWRWISVVLAVALAIILPSLVTRIFIPLLGLVARRLTVAESDRYIQSLKGPVRLVLMGLVFGLLARGAISVLARTFWVHVSRAFAVAGVTWLLIRIVEFVFHLRSQRMLQRHETEQLAILSLIRRCLTLLMIFVAAVVLLNSTGVNVSAVLAGLGIGGIALALAAQKTLENVFGGISIIMGGAVRVGDSCKIADEIGTIEDISLGSTRIRTADRTIITIPNSKVSQMNVSNYSMREKYWFHHVLGLALDTSSGQIRELLHHIADLLHAEPRVESDSARVRFIAFASASLSIEVSAYVRTNDYADFLEVQQDLLLRIMDVIAASGASIAVPVQRALISREKEQAADQQERKEIAGRAMTGPQMGVSAPQPGTPRAARVP
jgi:MscS family membrane protein